MFKKILSTTTYKQSQITVAGTFINGLLGALFYIVLARFLGPSDFGLLTIAVTTLVLIADMADIGTNTGLIRFVSSYLTTNKEKAWQYLKLSLGIKLAAWIVVFLALFFLSPVLAGQVFHKEELVLPLKLVAFGVGGALLFTFATSCLQAYQKYFLWSIVSITTNAIRLIAILILIYFAQLNVVNSLVSYITLSFFGFFVTLFILPTRNILQAKTDKNLLKELLRYNAPVAIFSLIAAVSARLDTFLNAALLTTREVGIYGAANQLVQFMPQLVSALGLVSAPKFASFDSNEKMLSYFKKFQLLVLGLAFLGILAIPIAIYLIPVLFGVSYQEAILPFVILFLGQLIFLLSIPVHHGVIFYFGRPDVFIWVSLGHLAIIGGIGYLMIQSFGMIGAAVTVFLGMIFNFLYPLIWLLIRLRKK